MGVIQYKNPGSWTDVIGITESSGMDRHAVNADHGDIGEPVHPDEFTEAVPAILEIHQDIVGMIHDAGRRDDETVSVEDHAGSNGPFPVRESLPVHRIDELPLYDHAGDRRFHAFHESDDFLFQVMQVRGGLCVSPGSGVKMPKAAQQHGADQGPKAVGSESFGMRTMHGWSERDTDASERGGRT